MKKTGQNQEIHAELPRFTCNLSPLTRIMYPVFCILFSAFLFADTWLDTTMSDFSGGTPANTETATDSVQIAARSDWWNPAENWWNPSVDWWGAGAGYQYRKAITVNNTGSSALTDYQVEVENPVYNETELTGSWHFEEGTGTNIADGSGNAGAGTMTIGGGGTQTTSTQAWTNGVSGKHGSAVNFDGSDDYISTGSISNMNISGEISVEAWIYPKTVSVSQQSITSRGGGWNRAGWLLTLNNNVFRWHLGNGSSEAYIDTATTVAVNTWTHVVGQWRNGVIYVYINGVKDNNTANWAAGAVTNSYTHFIGRADGGATFYYNGMIDELRVYNRALTVDEIYAHYQAKTKLNYGDIRFTNSTGTELPYWMEKDGTFWVKASGTDSIPAGFSTIYMYYGNSSAASVSNGSNTFPLFDNFDSYSGWTEEAWIYSGGTWTFSNSNSELRLYSANAGGWGRRTKKTVSLPNGTYYQRTNYRIVSSQCDVNYHTFRVDSPNQRSNVQVSSRVNEFSLGTGTSFDVFIGDINYGNTGSSDHYVDWILVRKYASLEPVVYVGSEVSQTSQWQYRKAIAVNNTGTSALSDYQVKVENPVYNENGLAGSWHFDEGAGTTAFDTSGNGNSGTLTNGTVWTINGKAGNALSLDGTDDYVNLPMSFPSANFTIETYFKLNSATQQSQTIFGGNADFRFGIVYNYTNNGKLLLDLSSNGSSWNIANAVTGVKTSWQAGQWYYLVLKFDGTAYKVLVDNVEDISVTSSTAVFNTTALWIGRWGNGTFPFNGLSDEVRIHNRTLSADEIQAHYNAKAKLNYGDIRFTGNSGTELPYWMEKDGMFWVRIGGQNSIPVGFSQILMYYGNSSANSTANGTAAFEFYDDFAYSSLDASKWSTVISNTSMSNTISNGEITIAVTSSSAGSVWGYLSGGAVFPSAVLKIRSKDNTAKTYPASFGFGYYLNSPQSGVAQGISTSDQFYYQTNLSGTGTYTSGYAADNNWHITEMFWTTGEVKFYRDNTLYFTSTTNIPSTFLPISLGNMGTGGGSGTTNDTIVDWVFARKYTATEPLVSVGSEVVSTSAWLYRQPLTVTNTSSTDILSKGYTVNSTLGIKTLSSLGKAQYDGDDVTVAYKDPSSGQVYEIDRMIYPGQALGVDGVDDYVSISDSSDFDFVNNNVTINLWLRPNSMPAAANGFISQVNNSQDWCAYVYPTGSVGTGKAGINEFTTPAGTVVAGNWYFVTILKNGGTSYIYINGTQAASSAISMWTDPANPLRIGGYVYGGSNYYFTGSLDEVTIFKRALLTSEIIELYNSGVPKPLSQTTLASDAGLVAYYPFDADFSDKAKTNNGTALNGASLTNGKVIAADNNNIWFRTITDISASSANSTDYFIYYGNSGAAMPAANPNNVYWFYDDFTRSDNTGISNWYETGDGSFSLNNNRILRPDATTGFSHTALAYPLGQVSDVVIRAKINTQSLSGSDEQIGLVVRGNTASDNSHRGYVLAWHENNGQLQNLDSGLLWLTSVTKSGWATGEWWNMELLVYGTTIKGKAWEDGTAEPVSYDVTDIRTTNSAGYVGLYTHSTAAASAYFDDFSVRKYITSAPTVSSGAEALPYNAAGSFTSAVKDTGADDTAIDSISWSTSGSGTISMQVRADNTNAGWTDSSPAWEDVTNGDTSIAYMGRYIQYKALFTGPGSANEPVLTDVTITYTLPIIPPSDSVSCDKLSNTWYSTATFTFTNNIGFGAQIDKYYYVFDSDTAHVFDLNESVWNTGVLSLNAAADGSWYLHYLPYSSTNTAGTAYDIGPFKYDGTTPSAITLALPANNDSLSDTIATFSWDAVTDLSGITYTLQLDNFTSFSSPVVNKTNLTDLTYALSGAGAEVLIGNSTYYWRVIVTDGAGNFANGGYRKFTTTSSVPQMINESTGEAYPDIQSAINSASTVNGDVINVKDTIAHNENITISKDVILENAVLSPSSGFAITGQGPAGGEILRNCVITKGGVSDLALGENLTLFNPDPSATLTIENSRLVNCLIENGAVITNSTLENCHSETTADYFVNAGTNDFHITSTAIGAIDKGKNLGVYFTDDIDGNSRGIDILEMDNFDTGAWDIGAYEFSPDSFYLTQPEPDAPPEEEPDPDPDPESESVPEEEQVLPSVPELNIPADGAQDIETSVVLGWYAAAGSGSITYTLQWSANEAFTSGVNMLSGIVTIYYVVNLSYDSTVYWRVKAMNDYGESAWSSVGSFTTKEFPGDVLVEQLPPGAPILIEPLDNYLAGVLPVVFRWYPALGTGDTQYHIQISADPDFEAIVVDVPHLLKNTYELKDDLSDARYYWCVRASNANGFSAWSNIWTFKMIAGASYAGIAAGEDTQGTSGTGASSLDEETPAKTCFLKMLK